MSSPHISHHPSLVLKAPAKINWTLYVLDKRRDGYHNILSLMHCIELYDTLTFESSDLIEVAADMEAPIEQNLVYKSAWLLKKRFGLKRGAKIKLDKEIPLGAGLGGGSSNAAYTLIGLNKLWDLGLSKNELKSLGSELGSDIPFFFDCPMAIVEGRGDILTPLKIDIQYTLLLVKPLVSISTAWAYKQRSKAMPELTKTKDKFNNIQLIYDALKSGDVSLIKSKVNNDFEELIIKKYPVIRELKEKLVDAGALMAIMSGSGSTVFGLFENREKAIDASSQFSSYWNRVVSTAIS